MDWLITALDKLIDIVFPVCLLLITAMAIFLFGCIVYIVVTHEVPYFLQLLVDAKCR